MAFQYRVRDPLGNMIEGTLDAASQDEAQQQLRRDGFQVLDLRQDDDAGELFPRLVRKNDIIYTTAQLAVMVDTGIALSDALAGILQQEANPTLRKLLQDLKDSVEGGEAFSAALARHPRYFDKTYISLIKASEATGTLGPMLERIAGYLRKEVDTRGKVRAAMAYPMVMLVVAVGVSIFLLTYVLPKFTPLFKSRSMQLPLPTKILINVSSVLLGYWYLWLAAAVALLAAYLLSRRTELGKSVLDRIKINLPILGPMFRKVTISRSIRTLGTMISSGVSVLDAITLCGEVAANYHYEKLWQHVREEVTTGKRICEALAGSTLFPRSLVQMIAAGEETGKLDYVLQRVSDYYDREVESSVKTTTALIEPLLIAFMGVVVGGIGMALMLPIFSLSRQP